MLDNLKLGYGGTKAEMLRLVNDSKVLNKTVKSLDEVTFDQIILAIHKVQDNMGITGTTAKEAEKTISGSVASMKSAWQNLLTGIANSQVDTTQLVKKFVDSVKTVIKNVTPVVKQSIKGLVDVAEDLLNELYGSKKFNFDSKKVVKNFENAVKKAIDTISWFIKNKDKFITAMKLMTSAFAVAKIAKWTTTLNSGVKAIMNSIIQMKLYTLATKADTASQTAHTTAQVAGKTATEVLTAKQAALNAVMSANPIGLVITAITTLITLYMTFKSKTDEVAQAEEELHNQVQSTVDATNEAKDAWKNLKEERQNSIDTGMSEIAYYENLYDELTHITDENGNVQAGYEKRANFILGRLNEALGTEYKMTENQIQGYKDLTSTIDELMTKKKAQLILESQENLYNEALNNRTKTMREILDLQDQINSRDSGRQAILDEISAKQKEYITVLRYGGAIQAGIYAKEIDNLNKRLQTYDADTQALNQSLSDKENLYNEYTYNMGLYENNLALAHEGAYDKMSTVDYEYTQKFKNADDQKKAVLQNSVKVAEEELEKIKGLYEETGDEVYKSQVQTAEKNLQNAKDSLAQYNSITYSKLNETNIIWSDQLSDQLSTITGAKIEFKDAGNGNVEMYIDGIASGKQGSKNEMAKIVTDTIKEVAKKEPNAEEAGKNLIRGFNNGEANVTLQNTATRTAESFGSKILAKLKQTLGIASPSKETKKMGAFLVEGLGLGIEKEENVALKEANNFGKSIINSMNKGLSKGVDTSLINSITGSIPSEYNTSIGINRKALNNDMQDNLLNYTTIFNGFMEALSKMKIELDDENMGKFVVKTVTDEIYT